MAATDIGITAEPIDDQRCKFIVSQPVLAGGVRRFSDPAEAKGSPLAEAIFAIPGLTVGELIVSGNIVTVVKQSPAPWQAVGRAVGNAIRTALSADVPAVASAPRPASGDPSAVNDDALYEQVAKVFDEQVNPMVARHGGRVELIDVQDAVVMLRMAADARAAVWPTSRCARGSRGCSRSSCPRFGASSTSPITPRAPTPTSRPPRNSPAPAAVAAHHDLPHDGVRGGCAADRRRVDSRLRATEHARSRESSRSPHSRFRAA